MTAIFHTQNKQLALALITCGCQWAEQGDGGPTYNTYTPEYLRDKGVMHPGRVSLEFFEEKVLDAVRRKIPGQVTWYFKRTAKLERAIEAWDNNVKLIQEHQRWEEMDGEQRLANPEFAPKPFPEISDEVVMQVLNFHATNRRKENVDKFIFANPALCSTICGKYTPGKQDKTATEARAGVTTGKGRCWSVTLSNEDRAHMGIHKRIE